VLERPPSSKRTAAVEKGSFALVRTLCRLGILAAVAACSPRPAPAGTPEAAPAATPAVAAAAPAKPGGAAPAASAESASPAALLRVGTSGDYAPFSVRDSAGHVTGFDIDIAEELARDLGLELRWVPFRWPDLGRQIQADEFDVAMGGVTWQPVRDVVGYMTRSLARGGPCVLGEGAARRVAVNRGGVLEAWARRHLSDRELVTVDDNQSLPELLQQGTVGAIVTDSFELRAFTRPGWASRCEPALARKVYWVSPTRASELGARIDGWLRANALRIQAAQERWFGARQRVDSTTHLADLLARRFAFMPLVAALKAQRDIPIEDPPREREVLEAVRRSAARAGLPEDPVKDLFTLLIELSKAVQHRQREPSPLDLTSQVRPALGALGDRIITALAERRAETPSREMVLEDLELLAPWLDVNERQKLLASVRGVLRSG
jgi:cyclohexadienyl dehydratase